MSAYTGCTQSVESAHLCHSHCAGMRMISYFYCPAKNSGENTHFLRFHRITGKMRQEDEWGGKQLLMWWTIIHCSKTPRQIKVIGGFYQLITDGADKEIFMFYDLRMNLIVNKSQKNYLASLLHLVESFLKTFIFKTSRQHLVYLKKGKGLLSAVE